MCAYICAGEGASLAHSNAGVSGGNTIHLTAEVAHAVGGGHTSLFAHLRMGGGDPEHDVELGRPVWGLKLPVSEPGN